VRVIETFSNAILETKKLYWWWGKTIDPYRWAFYLAGAYLGIFGTLTWLVGSLSFRAAQKFQGTLLPAYATEEVFFSLQLLNFVSLVLSIAIGLGMIWLLLSFPRVKKIAERVHWPYIVPTVVIFLAASAANPISAGSNQMLLGAIIFLASATALRDRAKKTTCAVKLQRPNFAVSALTLVLSLVVLALGVWVWYPIVLPPDYYEISETVVIPSSSMKNDQPSLVMPRATFVTYDVRPRQQYADFLSNSRVSMKQVFSFKNEYEKQFNQYLADNGVSLTEPEKYCSNPSRTSESFCNIFQAEIQSGQVARETNGESLIAYGKASPAWFSLLVAEKNWRTFDLTTQKETAVVCTNLQDRYPECNWPTQNVKHEFLNQIDVSIHKIVQWNVQAGRLLFHHSYLFVPAVHTLSHGLDGNVPFLYGYGNTLFHAALMKLGDPTLATYFATFPIAQCTGFLTIFLVILWITRSVPAAAAATSTSIASMYLIGATTVYYAPGLNPLRYAGLFLQVASIFFVFRSEWRLRLVALPVAFLASYFWNSEYALLGMTGQLLALASPAIKSSQTQRIIWFAISLLVTAGSFFLPQNPDFVINVQAGFFGVGTPKLEPRGYREFIFVVVASAIICAALAFRMSRPERDARLALLPIIALLGIKFLFNPSSAHLFFTCSAVLPLVLCYVPWLASGARRAYSKWLIAEDLATLLIVGGCLFVAVNYVKDRRKFNADYTGILQKYDWSSLGDSIVTTTPPEFLKSRVDAIRSELAPNQRLLLLSPFDHLLSFYINPPTYCGQFEMLTNLVSENDLNRVVSCVQRHPETLIVYDNGNDIICPSKDLIRIYDMASCTGKILLKTGLKTVAEILETGAKSSKAIGNLTFIRMDDSKLHSLDFVTAKNLLDYKQLYEEHR
jgi:hypothetical protein